MNPATTSNAASAKPAMMSNACAANASARTMSNVIQTAPNTMVVTASQRHNRMRARPNAAAVTMVM